MTYRETYTYDPRRSWRLLPELPFFWWLNPWKQVEELHDTLRDATNAANDWHKDYEEAVEAHMKDSRERDNALEDLRNRLDLMRGERDAANDAVRTLQAQMRKRRK